LLVLRFGMAHRGEEGFFDRSYFERTLFQEESSLDTQRFAGCLLFLQRRRGMEAASGNADSGPSFPALSLIRDDGLLRREFAAQLSSVRRGCTSQSG